MCGFVYRAYKGICIPGGGGGGGADNKAIEIRSIIEKNIIKDVGNEKT